MILFYLVMTPFNPPSLNSLVSLNSHEITEINTKPSQLLVFSVTPFKIDQNKKSKLFNRLSLESRNRKKVDMQWLSQRFRSQQFFYGRYAEKRFSQIYRDLHGDAMLVPT